MSDGQKGALVGARGRHRQSGPGGRRQLRRGVGAGLIGGAVGYLGGTAIGNSKYGRSAHDLQRSPSSPPRVASRVHGRAGPGRADQLRPGGLHHLQGSARHGGRSRAGCVATYLPGSMPPAYRRRRDPRRRSGRPTSALLVRGGCTLAPDAYLFTVIDRAVLGRADQAAEAQVAPLTSAQVSLTMTCLA